MLSDGQAAETLTRLPLVDDGSRPPIPNLPAAPTKSETSTPATEIDPAPPLPLELSADQPSVGNTSPDAVDGLDFVLQPLAPRKPDAAKPEDRKPADEDKEKEKASGDSTDRKPIGQRPEDYSHLFLRQATILLKPGQAQFDIAFTCGWSENQLVAFDSNGTPLLQRTRDREFLIPMTLRYGLSECFETYARLPVGLATFERADSSFDNETTRAGLGDVGGGVKYLWQRSEGELPDIVFSLGFLAPTGASKFGSIGDAAALGGGFWSLNAGVNVVKTYDPIVAYANLGYLHDFDGDFSGVSINPGEAFFYGFGFGFAITDTLTYSMEFAGLYRGDLRVGGVRVPNSSEDIGTIRIAIVRSVNSCTFVEPFVRFGLTSDGVDREFGMFFTRTIGN